MDITSIPRIMRANRWREGAILMEKWFFGPPLAMPFYTMPDLTTIKIDWVLNFPRAKDEYNKMLKDKVWANAAATPIIAEHLRSFTGRSFDFSQYSQIDVHDLHINHRKVEYSWQLDGLVAALGNFSIYVSPISGNVVNLAPDGRLAQVKIDRIGFQVMDSYDFEGDQFLGRWDEATNSVSMIPAAIPEAPEIPAIPRPGINVHNSSFQSWRSKNARGGDFQIFSDVKVITLQSPTVILI